MRGSSKYIKERSTINTMHTGKSEEAVAHMHTGINMTSGRFMYVNLSFNMVH